MKAKYLNITHADIDGAACSILLKNKFDNENVEIVPISFSRADYACTRALNDWSKHYEKIFITDVYPDESIAKKFEGTNIFMYDHHDSNVSSSKHCIINKNKNISAAYVVAKNINGLENLSKDLKALVFLTTDYDSYKLSDKRSRELNLLYFGKYHFNEYVERFYNGFDGFTNSEKVYLENVEREIKELKAQVPDNLGCWNLGGYKISVCPIYDHMNDITDYIFDLEPYTDICIVLRKDKKRGSVRIRPTEFNDMTDDMEFDMEHFITKVLKVSGGGHKFSGGFEWSVKDEIEGIPEFLLDFRKWDKKLKKENFYAEQC